MNLPIDAALRRVYQPKDRRILNNWCLIFIDDMLIDYVEVPDAGEYNCWITMHSRLVIISKEGRTDLKFPTGGLDLDESDLNGIEFTKPIHGI